MVKYKIKWKSNEEVPSYNYKRKVLVDFGDNDYCILIWSPKVFAFINSKNKPIARLNNIVRWIPLDSIAKFL